MKIYLILLLSAAILPLAAGNSIFSYDGFPVQFYGKDIYSLGMGDTGASDIFRNNTGYANPALHNLSNRSLFSTGILLGYNQYRSRDAGGGESSYLDNSLDFPYFSISIPVKQHRLGFQFNSYAAGVVANQRQVGDILEKQSMDRYLHRVDLIYSYGWKGFQAGVSGNYYFGHDVREFSQDSGNGLFNTNEELSRTYSNPGVTVGVLKYFDKLSLGAHYSLGSKLSGSEKRVSIHEEETLGDYDYELPDRLAVSATAMLRPELKLAADAHYELWDKIAPDTYEDAWKASLGLAYEPNPGKDKVLLRLPLRGGLSYRHLPFQSGGAGIDELGLSLGMSVVLKGNVNRIDLGLQWLKRGDLDSNGLTDTSYLLMLGFSGFDIISKAPNRTAPRDIPVKDDVESW